MFLAEDNVSGDATFAGTNYQASVIAYVFVHVLTETKLRWIALADDTPSAVSGEVGGRETTPALSFELVALRSKSRQSTD